MSVHHKEMPALIWDSVGMDTSSLSYSSKEKMRMLSTNWMWSTRFESEFLSVLMIRRGKSSKDKCI